MDALESVWLHISDLLEKCDGSSSFTRIRGNLSADSGPSELITMAIPEPTTVAAIGNRLVGLYNRKAGPCSAKVKMKRSMRRGLVEAGRTC